MKNKRITAIIVGTALILSIPLLAGWPWTLIDFVAAAVLLLGTGFIFEFLARKIKGRSRRIILGIVLVGIMLLIWADLAVGIFNIPGFSGN